MQEILQMQKTLPCLQGIQRRPEWHLCGFKCIVCVKTSYGINFSKLLITYSGFNCFWFNNDNVKVKSDYIFPNIFIGYIAS